MLYFLQDQRGAGFTKIYICGFFFKNPSGVEGVKARENELGNFLQIVANFFLYKLYRNVCHIYNGAFQRREQQQQAVWWKQFFAIFNLKNLQKSVKFSAYKNFHPWLFFIFGGGILSISANLMISLYYLFFEDLWKVLV